MRTPLALLDLRFCGGTSKVRSFCVAAGRSHSSPATKSFDDMPGPRGPFGLGNLYNYWPLIGRYSWQELHRAGLDKYRKYGPIVRETMVPGLDIVWLYEPSDIAVLLNERDHPQRRSHLALEKYRKDRPHVYRTAGLLPTNGSEWWRLRSELQQEIGAPRNVRDAFAAVDRVTKEFTASLQLEESFDILPKLARLNLELTCLLTFDERLKAFAPEELPANSRSSRLIRSAEITNSSILPTDQGLQLWRRFETPAYKRLRRAQEYMEGVAIGMVDRKMLQLKDSSTLSGKSLVEAYLKNPRLDLCDIVGTAADLLLAGIDTTSYTMAFTLYHIARHPEVQHRLHEESLKVIDADRPGSTTESWRSQIPYTRAVLKEVFRLNPISVGVGRILNRDLVLSDYLVPKGTVVVTQNMIACRLEKHFDDPLRFLPDRWLGRQSLPNPYLVLPFGHGARACIARRLAEQNILILIMRMVRSFEIFWAGSDVALDVRTLLINKPSEPVTILLKPRENC